MKLIRLFLVMTFVGLLLGCGGDKTTTPEPTNGTFTVLEMPEGYLPLLDSLAFVLEDPELSPGMYEGDPEIFPPGTYDHYSVEIVWGRFDDSPTTDLAHVDWSGALEVNSIAALIPAHLIDFERDEDWIVKMRGLNPVGWVSKTHGGFDGIRFEIFVRTDIMTLVAPELIMKTHPFAHRWYVADLDGLEEVYNVGEHQQVRIKARQVQTNPCPHGATVGRWVFKDRSKGYFYGRWLTQFGLSVGHMIGKFWTTDDGERVFEGYWIGLDNQLAGKLHGKWAFSEADNATSIANHHPTGIFRGRFTDRNHDFVGSLEGNFGHRSSLGSNDADYHPNWFKGRWWIDCPDIASQ